ncbi:MAG TPA: hypothetical protein DCE42_06865 [Myxococcales bacterium]|nr:hypothetical protein [Deltaproteobacteria bacterium]MBU50840.1 hypothetical protein [Deltaproteobacteria bacterium]HAA54459.1 hypothetical protein [Myxococcales bacterium]|tara:strand:- start:1372 stop:2322 length:951 start_codon:yes stop_codon:yes gene_type:complete
MKLSLFCLSIVLMFSFPTQSEAARKRRPSPTAQSTQWHDCGKRCRARLYKMSTKRIDRLLRYAQRALNVTQRLELFGRMFLGGRYKFGPLGEGRKGRWDRDPTFRLDKVDCVTFIETVMAMALSRSLKETKRVMQQIRYKDGIIRYEYRNHFTAQQWLVENEKKGYIKRATKALAGKYAKPYAQKVTNAFWRSSYWGRRLPKPFRIKSYTVWYVPLKDVHKIAHRLPNLLWMGEVFDQPSHPSSIAHVGFLVRKKGKLYFRHANIGRRGVREEPLSKYTRWRQKYYDDSPKSRYHILGYTFAYMPMTPTKTASAKK